jgi:hypothetical protein
MGDSMASPKSLSILLVCYGDHAPYSCRAIRTLTDSAPDLPDIHIGCNACGKETLAWRRYHASNC